MWELANRADPFCCDVADRHYSRQKIGSPQFVPPGRCHVLKRETEDGGKAVWVTSWPFAQYVKHAWAGAWVNSFFRNEGAGLSSELILSAIIETQLIWEPPPLGMITFVCPKRVPPTTIRGAKMWGYCYQKAGFKHVGFTKGGLWAWQMLPHEMPAIPSISAAKSTATTPTPMDRSLLYEILADLL